jgi:hypothetical protein
MQKTKSILIYRIDNLASDGLMPKKHIFSEFDRHENLLHETHYNSEEEPEQIAEYKYDESGRLLEEKLFAEENELIEWRTYERDSEGRIIKEFQHYQDGTFDTTIYIYDDKMRLVEQKKTDTDGFVESVEVNEYEEDNLLSETVMDGDGNIIEKISYSYNNEGVLEASEHLSVENAMESRMVNYFDDKGNKYKTLRYNFKNQLIEIVHYEFDDHGSLITIEEENQLRKSRVEMKYDEKNNPVSQVETNEAGELLSTVKRSFDETDKVIESKVFIDGLGIRLDQDYVLQYEYEYFND